MLSPHPNVQGPIPRITTLLVRGLRAAGCEIEIAPWGRHSDTESLAAKLTGRFRDVLRVRALVSQRQFDAVVVKTSLERRSLLRDVPLLLAVRSRVAKLVFEFHGGNPDQLIGPGNHALKWASRLLLRRSDGALFLSGDEVRSAAAFCPGGRFAVIVNPFLPANHAPPPRNDPDSSSPTLIYASRLVTEKGIFDTLDAFAALRDRRPCRLVVAGTGAAAEAVASRVEALGLAADVRLAGQLPYDELVKEYRAADVFVLPTYWGEGFPTAITEAMDAGLPIVTTKIRGMADHLTEGVNAVFVPPRAPAALADALENLLADAALRARMSAANRAKVKDFEPEAAARLYLQALAAIGVDGEATPPTA